MARQIIERLIDDTDGSEAAERVRFALDGILFEIDLSEVNAEALRGILEPYVEAGTRVRSGWSTGRSARRTDRLETQRIREWAAQNGIPIKGRGRIPVNVVEQYRADRTVAILAAA